MNNYLEILEFKKKKKKIGTHVLKKLKVFREEFYI